MNQNGGIKLLMILACVTLVLVGGGVFLLTRSYQKDQPVHRRKALQISEYGLLQALQQLQQQPSWHEGFDKTEYKDGWYTVTLQRSDSAGTPITTLVSTGYSGALSRRQICELYLSTDKKDSVWVQKSLRQE
jgi:hypothetical protein